MNATMRPVVLGVGGADPANNVAAMEFALNEARQRGVPIEVVHGCRPRHQLIPTHSWVESEQHDHGRRIVGRVAQRLRRMSRYEVQVRVTNTDTSGVDALLTASASASVVVLQAPARSRTGQVAAPGSTIRAVVARAACPVVVLHRERAVGTSRGLVVGVKSTVAPKAPCWPPWSRPHEIKCRSPPCTPGTFRWVIRPPMASRRPHPTKWPRSAARPIG